MWTTGELDGFVRRGEEELIFFYWIPPPEADGIESFVLTLQVRLGSMVLL